MMGEGDGGDFPNVDSIAVGGNAVADSDEESRFSEYWKWAAANDGDVY